MKSLFAACFVFPVFALTPVWAEPLPPIRIVHVAPADGDSGDGSSAHPFSSPAGALTALAKRSEVERRTAISVLLHKGVYRLTTPLKITPASAGTPDAPVTWKAAGDGEVVFSGGIEIPGDALRPVTDSATLARLPKSDAVSSLYEIRLADIGLKEFPKLEPHGMQRESFRAWPELFSEGKPLPLATWPNGTGYVGGFKPTKIISAGTTAKVVAGGATSSVNTDKSSPMIFSFANERTARWKSAMENHHAAVWFGGHWFWDWADDFIPAAGIAADGAITMAERHHYGIGRDADLHVFNLVEEMDRPGEYALEPAATRILVLLTPEMRSAGLTLSLSHEPLVTLEKCGHVRFEGIRFAYGRFDGVSVSDASAVTFSHCVFENPGRDGISAKGEGIVAEDCVFARTGATAVSLDGGVRATLTTSGNRLSRCEFSEFGRLKRTYAPGVRLSGVGATVENCLFHDAPHAAILFGGNEHIIRDNEIRHVLTETGDCGAIYGGRDWTTFGTVISGNWIHDLSGLPGRWPCAVYLDDALSGITVKNNLIGHADLGMLIGGGRYDIIEGNLIRDCAHAISMDSRLTGWGKTMLPVLKQRLAAIPSDKEPWASRYPMLRETLTMTPEKPVGTRVVGNVIAGCKAVWLNRAPSGVAMLAPNRENDPKVTVSEEGRTVRAEGTTLVFTKPEVGPRN